VARAKRTDRAEARRRHRAASIDQPDLDEGLEEAAGGSAPSARAVANRAPSARTDSVTPSTPSAPTATRPSLGGAFRSSFRPIDLRGDLSALPRLLRHWSFFIPVVLSGVAVVLFQYFPKDSLAAAYFGYFAGVTPFGAVLFAGFFAPRAAWLLGILVSIVAALFLGASLYVQYAGLPDGVFIDTGVNQVNLVPSEVAKAEITQFVVQAVTVGAVYGGLFAAAAAWYRRFLNRASPNRARPTSSTARRPDGKVPKKPQQRPMLARRR
jgi:drug/metabolite transporter (DMT)-like permease